MQECKNTQTQRGTRSRSTKTAISFLSRQMQQLFYENYEQNKKGYIRDLHNSKHISERFKFLFSAFFFFFFKQSI